MSHTDLSHDGRGGARASRRMQFSVEGWDPAYGATYAVASDPDEDLSPQASSAQVRADVEVPAARWRPMRGSAAAAVPHAVVFVDGVRRIEARVWTQTPRAASPDGEAALGVCASYAAGTVCSCQVGAHVAQVFVRRSLITTDPAAVDIPTRSGTYVATYTSEQPGQPLTVTLSQALQSRLTDLEAVAAAQARPTHGDGGAEHGAHSSHDLLVVDGPLRGRTHLDRALGLIKTHQTRYLPPPLHAMVASLGPGERTPVFGMGTTWERHSWYLRLPCAPGAPWAGVVRLECSAGLPADVAVALAETSQAVLPRFASSEFKDPRAPQNLYPIAGLERELRRRLGDARLMYRALRLAARPEH